MTALEKQCDLLKNPGQLMMGPWWQKQLAGDLALGISGKTHLCFLTLPSLLAPAPHSLYHSLWSLEHSCTVHGICPEPFTLTHDQVHSDLFWTSPLGLIFLPLG